MPHRRDGFDGPASPKADYTGTPYYAMEQDLVKQLKSLMQARLMSLESKALFSMDHWFTPVSLMTREIVAFHSVSKPWGHLMKKVFVKDQLVDRLSDFYQYTLDNTRDAWDWNTRTKHFVDIDTAYRMGSDIYMIGTFLGGLTKTESAGLYRALMGMLMYKKEQRRFKYRQEFKKAKIEMFRSSTMYHYPSQTQR